MGSSLSLGEDRGIGSDLYSPFPKDGVRLSGNSSIFFPPFPDTITPPTAMAQILDPLPNPDTDPLLCCYVNATSQIQVARITNIANWYFERVVFPGQRLVFETLPGAILEIHTGMMASAILSDTIPCERLVFSEIQETMEAETGAKKAEGELEIDHCSAHVA